MRFGKTRKKERDGDEGHYANIKRHSTVLKIPADFVLHIALLKHTEKMKLPMTGDYDNAIEAILVSIMES